MYSTASASTFVYASMPPESRSRGRQAVPGQRRCFPRCGRRSPALPGSCLSQHHRTHADPRMGLGPCTCFGMTLPLSLPLSNFIQPRNFIAAQQGKPCSTAADTGLCVRYASCSCFADCVWLLTAPPPRQPPTYHALCTPGGRSAAFGAGYCV
jgi:hypothetical protein